MKNYIKETFICILLITVLIVTGCRYEKTPVNKAFLDGMVNRQNNPWNIHMVDSAISLLHSGDVVVRTGNDATSYILCQLNKRDKTYSHCGIVMVENGYPFVYHSIGGEDNPDAKLRRDSACFWFSPAHNLGFGVTRLDISTEKTNILWNVVRKFYKERKKFDMKFDLASDDRFYCAEFIYKSVNQAMNDSTYLQPGNIFGYTIVGIDDIRLSSHARTVCQIRFK